jgi:predicted SAM-dependent methyltransferase
LKTADQEEPGAGPQSLDQYLTTSFPSTALSDKARELAKRALTTARLPAERRVAGRIVAERKPLRLHLGSADTYLSGWCNVDLARPGRRLDLRWDLRRALPFPDGVAEAIFSEHLLEHIPFQSALQLLVECHRVLRPGGVCRIGVPDLERYVRSYLGTDPIIDEVRPGSPTRAMAVAELFFLHGHRSMYDFETLAVIGKRAGFGLVERSTFGQGRIIPCPDTATRAPETLYVDAVKNGPPPEYSPVR